MENIYTKEDAKKALIARLKEFYQRIAGKPIEEQIDAARANALTITIHAGPEVHSIKPLVDYPKLWRLRKEHAIADWHFYANGEIYLNNVKVYGKGVYRG